MKLARYIVFSIAAAAAFSAMAAGVDTSFWQTGTFDDFLKGNLNGVSLSRDGQLRLAPQARVIFNPEETLALSLAGDKKGNLYIGTGHQGKVFRVGPDQKGTLLFQAPEPEILALAVSADGALYVASSPDGKIYRVTPDGKSSAFYKPKAKYVWAMAFGATGDLYAGTGDKGHILKIDPAGKGEVFFDSAQTHIMCLTFDRRGNLLAGTEPNGLIYRVDSKGKGFILYQANLPEIHALATDDEGRIYAAALGGAAGKGTPEFFNPGSQPPPATGTTTVTVVASTDGDVPQADPPAEEQRPSRQITGSQPPVQPPAQNYAFPLTQVPQGKGAVIQIQPDGTGETIWNAANESIFALVLRGRDVVFSTDTDGRVFTLTPSSAGARVTLLAETREALATQLLLHGGNVYVATSNIAKLFQLGDRLSSQGSYESAVKDSKFVSHWGAISWRAQVPAGAALEFYSRSGNSERPDNTWSDWDGPYTNAEATAVKSPPARYLQWKAVFRGADGQSPSLDEVNVSYLNQNLPPQIHSLNVSTGGERTGTGNPSSSSPASTTTVTTVTTTYGNQQQSVAPGKPPVTFNWQAEDPNGDQLAFALYVRAEDEREWHLVKDKIHDASYTLEANSLADGKYAAKLVASDSESNPPDTARQAELVSAPFWIDNSPPEVKATGDKVYGSDVEVHFRAESRRAPLRNAEWAIDGDDWQDLQSDDGIVDSRVETFTLKDLKVEPGEHIITLRVYDTSGNVGTGKAVMQVSGGQRVGQKSAANVGARSGGFEQGETKSDH